ncbi:hypothetical protein FOA52_010079 [Chlamydomonas sp. UWO 241]|nr:hypothetical protein FOA52_010079 [Chlamydomonas sp. UWO 241]
MLARCSSTAAAPLLQLHSSTTAAPRCLAAGGRQATTGSASDGTRRSLPRPARGRGISRRRVDSVAPYALATHVRDISPARSPSRTQDMSSQEVVMSFFDALNSRDIGGLLSLCARDVVHEDLAHEQTASDRKAVAKFYLGLFESMADNMQFVVGDITGGDSPTVGVTWHIAVEGCELPLSRGIGFYRLNSQKKISYLRQSPEHFLKLGDAALSAAGNLSPFVSVLGPAVSPSFWAAATSDGLASLMGSVDNAVAGLFTFDDSNSSYSQAPRTAALGVRARVGSGGAQQTRSPPPRAQQPRAQHAAPAPAARPAATASTSAAAAASMSPVAPAPVSSSAAGRAQGMGAGMPASTATVTSSSAAVTSVTSSAAAGRGQRATASAASAASASHHVMSATSLASALTAAATQASAVAGAGAATAAAPLGAGAAAGAGAATAAAPVGTGAAAGAGAAAAVAGVAAASAAGGDGGAAGAAGSAAVSVAAAGTAGATGNIVPAALLRGSRGTADALAGTADAPDAAAAGVAASAHTAATAPAASTPAPTPDSTLAPTPSPTPAEDVDLSGVWSKVPELSDDEAYERCLDLWGISGMQKATAKLIEGLEISHAGPKFHVHHLTMIPYFKVTEKYDLERPCKVMRRDLRSGHATADARWTGDRRGVALDVAFGAPFPGRLVEVYHSPEADVMHVTSTIHVRDRSVAVIQVYTRDRALTKEQLLRASERKNGSATNILRGFGAPL